MVRNFASGGFVVPPPEMEAAAAMTARSSFISSAIVSSLEMKARHRAWAITGWRVVTSSPNRPPIVRDSSPDNRVNAALSSLEEKWNISANNPTFAGKTFPFLLGRPSKAAHTIKTPARTSPPSRSRSRATRSNNRAENSGPATVNKRAVRRSLP